MVGINGWMASSSHLGGLEVHGGVRLEARRLEVALAAVDLVRGEEGLQARRLHVMDG